MRLSESREAQAELAEKYGIEGFCYWHYWFGGGKRLLERPFTEVLSSGKPNFPFCLAWANHSWKKKLWDPNATFKDKLLVEQTYPGDEDIKAHFYTVLPAFKDKRYITINECPLFCSEFLFKSFLYINGKLRRAFLWVLIIYECRQGVNLVRNHY